MKQSLVTLQQRGGLCGLSNKERTPDEDGISEQLTQRAYSAAADLQELTGKIIATSMGQQKTRNSPNQTPNVYTRDLSTASLNREVAAWYQGLPKELQWTSSDWENSLPCLMLLQ
jgi:hypothetical protein